MAEGLAILVVGRWVVNLLGPWALLDIGLLLGLWLLWSHTQRIQEIAARVAEAQGPDEDADDSDQELMEMARRLGSEAEA